MLAWKARSPEFDSRFKKKKIIQKCLKREMEKLLEKMLELEIILLCRKVGYCLMKHIIWNLYLVGKKVFKNQTHCFYVHKLELHFLTEEYFKY